MDTTQHFQKGHIPWNKGKLLGQKQPLKLQEIWAIRMRLLLAGKARDLALFNLTIDSKLRYCDLIELRITEIAHRDQVKTRAMVVQQEICDCFTRKL